MVRWHHRLNGHVFEQAPGDGDGQGGLVCCSPWGRQESDMTERLNNEYFAAKDGEALYSQQKQDQELTVAQIMNSLLPNSDLN